MHEAFWNGLFDVRWEEARDSSKSRVLFTLVKGL